MSLSAIFHTIQVFMTHHMVLSPLIYVLSHILFAICLVPCSPMAVIAGVLWGKWLGLGISITAAFLSSCTTFGLSRLLLRKKIHAFMSKRYAKTDWFLAQTKQHGWKFVATVQLNPAAPGSSLGYLFGLTGIEFSVYAFFLVLFMLPLQIILVICGDSFPELLSGNAPWIFAAVMVLAVVYLLYGLRHEKKL
ncbi:MAG: VTT domain-containing protein [Legionellaceae bacterium]|nr:VTT domain-containing protein [Legionellaceae bacterium]